MLPIEIVLFPASTDFFINKKLGIGINDLKNMFKINTYKLTLKYKKAGAYGTWYSIPFKMSQAQKKALLIQLYEAAKLDLKHETEKLNRKQELENKRKTLKNNVPDVITGFAGNLITSFIFFNGNSKHDKIRVYEAD